MYFVDMCVQMFRRTGKIGKLQVVRPQKILIFPSNPPTGNIPYARLILPALAVAAIRMGL